MGAMLLAPLLMLAALVPVWSSAVSDAASYTTTTPGTTTAAGTITTIAGNPIASGTAVSIGQQPVAVSAAPGGGFYVSDGNWSSYAVRRVDASGNETTVAGDGAIGYSITDGPATSEGLGTLWRGPRQVATDSAGDVLIPDSGHHVVRMVAAADCSSSCPYGLASTTKGYIYTVAGNGTQGSSGDGGPATSAELDTPYGLVVDASGDALISDGAGQPVRLVAASDCSSSCPFGLASMTKGDIYSIAAIGAPELAIDPSGDLLVADWSNNVISLVAVSDCSSSCPYGLSSMTAGTAYTIAGGGSGGVGGPATSASIGVHGVAVDAAGDVLITGNTILLVAASDCSSSCPYGLSSMTKGDIYTVAGDGTAGNAGDGGPATSAEFYGDQMIAVDTAGNLLIADNGNNVVRMVASSNCSSSCAYGLSSTTEGYVYTVAGNGNPGASGDGNSATDAGLGLPYGVATDGSGDTLIADDTNSLVRLVAGSTCSSSCPYGLSWMGKGDIYTIAGNGKFGSSGDGGPALSAELAYPGGVATDSRGDVLISDINNQSVRLVAASDCSSSCPYGLSLMTQGDIYMIASSSNPYDVATGPGDNALVADGNGEVQLVAASGCSSSCPFGLSSMTAGASYVIAGGGTDASPGTGIAATSLSLQGTDGVAFDGRGDALVPNTDDVLLVAAADCSSSCPFGLSSMTAGDAYTVAGGGSSALGAGGVPALGVSLTAAGSVALDGVGDLLIADGSAIRLVAAADCSSVCPYGLTSMAKGDIYTIAGGSTAGFSGDGGPATSAEFGYQLGIAVDPSSNLLVGDLWNNRVREVTFGPSGSGGTSTTPSTTTPSTTTPSTTTPSTTTPSTTTPSTTTPSTTTPSTTTPSTTTPSTTTPSTTTPSTTTPSTTEPSARTVRHALVSLVVPHGLAAKIRHLLRHGYNPRFAAPSAGRLWVRWYRQVGRRHEVVVARLTIAHLRRRDPLLSIGLTRQGRRLLRHARRLRLTATASFTPSGSSTVTITRHFTVRR